MFPRPVSLRATVLVALLLAAALGCWQGLRAHQAARIGLQDDTLRVAEIARHLLRNQRFLAAQVARDLSLSDLSGSAPAAFAALGPLRPGVRAILVIDAAGQVVADNRQGGPAIGSDRSGRPYFVALQGRGAPGWTVAPLAETAGSDGALMVTALPLRRPDGTFAGVVATSVSTAYFGGLVAERGARILLWHRASGRLLPLDGGGVPAGVAPLLAGDQAIADAAPLDAVRITPVPRLAEHETLAFAARPVEGGALTLVLARPRAAILRAALLRGGLSALAALVAITGLVLVINARRATMAQIRAAATQARHLQERLQLATSSARIGVWEIDLGTGQMNWDDTMYQLYGACAPAFDGTVEGWLRCLNPADRAGARAALEAAYAAHTPMEHQFRLRADTGADRLIRSHPRFHTDAEGQAARLVGIDQDVTEAAHYEEALIAARDAADRAHKAAEAERALSVRAAMTDPLTELANRRGLEAFIETLQERFPGATRLGWLHIDLDRFKAINDRYGHAAGDALLCDIADVLREVAGQTDLAARLGGDEFAVILGPDRAGSGITVAAAKARAEAIVEACRAKMHARAGAFNVGACVGIATGPLSEVRQIAIDADDALYAAKRAGRDRAVRATPAMRAAAALRLEMADRLADAIARDRITVAFQPQVAARGGALWGVEALVRWQDDRLGSVPPSVFLPVADEIGADAAIDRAVLRRALAGLDRLAQAGLRVPRLAVNVSASRLRDPGLLSEVRALWASPDGTPAAANGMRPALSFELLETIDFDGIDGEMADVLAGLRALGVTVELDDFGSGRASLTALLQLKPDRIKLDQRLIARLETPQTRDDPLVRALSDMGRGLGIGVTAEGVETAGQARVVADMGCDVVQGYHVAPPLDEAGLRDFLRRRQAHAPARLHQA